MKRKNVDFFCHILMQWGCLFALGGIFITFTLGKVSSLSVLRTNTVSARSFHYDPHNIVSGTYLKSNSRYPREKYVRLRNVFPVPQKDVFRMGPSDALVDSKWSQPVAEHHQLESHDYTVNNPTFLPFSRYIHSLYSSPEKKGNRKIADSSGPQILKSTVSYSNEESEKSDEDLVYTKSAIDSNYKNKDSVFRLNFQSSQHGDLNQKQPSTSVFEKEFHLSRNNFTNSNDSQIYVPSNIVHNYQSVLNALKNPTESKINSEHMFQSDSSHDSSDTESAGKIINTFTFSATDTMPYDHDALQKETATTKYHLENPASPKSIGYDELEYFTSTEDFVPDVYATLNYSATKTNDSEENYSLFPADNTVGFKLSSGAVTGIVIAVLVCVTLLTSAVIYLLYRRYSGKCTSVVDGKYNSDNCGYLDDSLRSSVYLNNHIELPKENSEEMTSLDNDSFLNSLETMTIQNYWADNTKNTKV